MKVIKAEKNPLHLVSHKHNRLVVGQPWAILKMKPPLFDFDWDNIDVMMTLLVSLSGWR